MARKFKVGDKVLVEGKRTTLIGWAYTDGPNDNGWSVDPPVKNIRWWNEDEMRPLHPTATITMRTADLKFIANMLDEEFSQCDEVNAYSNRLFRLRDEITECIKNARQESRARQHS